MYNDCEIYSTPLSHSPTVSDCNAGYAEPSKSLLRASAQAQAANVVGQGKCTDLCPLMPVRCTIYCEKPARCTGGPRRENGPERAVQPMNPPMQGMGPGPPQPPAGYPGPNPPQTGEAFEQDLDADAQFSRLGLWTNNSADDVTQEHGMDPSDGVKIFVGGLARQTKSQDLAQYFGQFGEVIDAVVMYNHYLGVSRGFGFVTFADQDISHYVLSQRHSIHNKSVEAKLAVPRDPGSRRRDGGPRLNHRGHRHNRGPPNKYPGGYGRPHAAGPGHPGWSGPTVHANGHHSGLGYAHGNPSGFPQNPAMPPEVGCKLFIGGLSWDTDEPALLNYFRQFGEVRAKYSGVLKAEQVVDAMVVYNHTMGVSRGFGFVTFNDRSVAENMVKMVHCINGKTVEAKLALPKGEHIAESLEEKMSKQIFVGGLPHNTTSDQLKEWAQRQFGPHNLANAIAVIDLKTKVTRGFGFIQFTTPEMVDFAVQLGLRYEMNSKRVTVKRAQAHQPLVAEMIPLMEAYQQAGHPAAMQMFGESIPYGFAPAPAMGTGGPPPELML